MRRTSKPRQRLTFWNIWLAWIAANAAGWTVGFGLAQMYSRALYANDSFIQRVLEGAAYIWTRPLDSPLATASYGLMLGAAIGLGQWLVLRRQFDITWQAWLAVTALGFTLHGLIMGLDVNLLGSDLTGPDGELLQSSALASVGLLCSGTVLAGIPQWLVLRPFLPKAAWWIAASFVGLLLASPDRSGGTNSLISWTVASLGAGAVFGIVTSLFLYFMMPVQEQAVVS